MRTIHVWPRYIKEFLLTHLGCNSPPEFLQEFTHFSPSRGSETAQAENSTPTVGKERSATAPLGFAISQPPQRENKRGLLALFSCTIQGAINKRKEKTTRE